MCGTVAQYSAACRRVCLRRNPDPVRVTEFGAKVRGSVWGRNFQQTHMDTKQTKPQRTNKNNEFETNMEDEFWPRYIVISAVDEPMRLSPFAILKGIQGIAGTPVDVKRLRTGDIVVQVDRKAHAMNLLKTTSFVNVNVKCSQHRSLNTSKGILRCHDLADTDDKEILEELRSQGVVELKRFNSKINGEIKKTNTFLLTFNTPDLPQDIRIGYLNCPIRRHIPNPMRCFKCQRYGHTESRCRQVLTCSKCGTQGHSFTDCDQQAKCLHCAGNHPAGAKVCPRWQEEKEILALKTNKGISFPEARRQYQEQRNMPSLKKSFANVVKAVTTSVETQTDITWVRGDKYMSAPSSKSTSEVQTKNRKEMVSCATQATPYSELELNRDRVKKGIEKTKEGRENAPSKQNSQRVHKAQKGAIPSDDPVQGTDRPKGKGPRKKRQKKSSDENEVGQEKAPDKSKPIHKSKKSKGDEVNRFSPLETDMEYGESTGSD